VNNLLKKPCTIIHYFIYLKKNTIHSLSIVQGGGEERKKRKKKNCINTKKTRRTGKDIQIEKRYGRMRAANYKLDFPITIKLVPPTKQTLLNLVNRNSNPHLATEENLQKS